MEHINNLRERFEALEQQTEQLQQQPQVLEAHIPTVERRLRWWRGIACGVGLFAWVSFPLPSGTAQVESADKAGKSLAQRLGALRWLAAPSLLRHRRII